MTYNYNLKNTVLSLFTVLSLPLFGQQFDNGIFVLNEGGAGSNNASVSFIDPTANVVTNDIFATANPTAGSLGDTAQSLNVNGDYIYIVLNISNTIRVVEKDTFTLVTTISEGLSNPRYMAFANGKAYVTNWGSGGDATDDYLAIIDLATNTVTSTIPLGEGVERILNINDKLYVAHQGGYSYGHTVSVVNPETDTLETIINVGDVPNRMVEKDGFLYVLCSGNPFWSSSPSDGSLYKIDLSDNSVTESESFTGLNTSNLQISGETIFFSSDAVVYQAPIENPLGYTSLINLEPQGTYGIYGMDLIDSKLYVADAGNYASPGHAYVYNLSGELTNDYTVGVIPNGFYKTTTDLGVKETIQTKYAIYPNPATNIFFIKTSENPMVTIHDALGRTVQQSKYNSNGIDVSKLSAGIYFVNIQLNGASSSQKLIVK